ncbi:MAG TPA: LysM domain-containing protein [Planctomycetota bacterium]|nr:LysM domain-containing protein [Planctomycetota bacterium]
MSPEKVAVLLVTGLITVLLATALVNAEKAEAAPRPSAGIEPRKAAAARPDPLGALEFDDLKNGRFRTPPARTEPPPPLGPEEPPPQYVIKRGDTLRGIASKQLGGVRHVAALIDANPGIDPNRLRAGDRIALPRVGALSSKAAAPKAPARKSGGAKGSTSAPKRESAPRAPSKKPAPKTAPTTTVRPGTV